MTPGAATGRGIRRASRPWPARCGGSGHRADLSAQALSSAFRRSAGDPVGLHDDRAGCVVANALAVARAEHGDQAHQAEEDGVDDQQDAADEELDGAGRAAVLADHPHTEELHPERLTTVTVRPV